jgi:hypothetical protein
MNDANDKRLPAPGSVRRVVYDCIVDLHNANRQVSRQVISQETSMTFSVIDDHIKRLKDDKLIRLVVNGIFEPVELDEDRAVSFTFVNGKVKMEIGDLVIELTMREYRAVAMGSAGGAMLFAR